ncbi:DUF4192 domain-containing protein [Nocardioides dubius]|uniref:DUF4192 domain-containing protein n=1 Tax=Nocardioides dubius TaxID=317019 RepID=A0ABP4E792_9ACTN
MTNSRRLVIRTPEDVAALVPCVLGFHPEESLVLLTFGAPAGFHARIDLPATDLDRMRAVLQLLEAARSNAIASVIAVCYAVDPEQARLLVAELERGFAAAGIAVFTTIRVADGAWFPLSGRHASRRGSALHLERHPFLAEARRSGRAVHASRSALVASLRTDPDRADQVQAALAQGVETPPEPESVRRLVERRLAVGGPPTPEQVAELLVALDSDPGRAELRRLLAMRPPAAHLRLWPAVVRAAPAARSGEPLAVLGLAAWLIGDGALGWCAVDRLVVCAPQHPVRAFLEVHLERAVPPSRRSLDLLTGWGDS